MKKRVGIAAAFLVAVMLTLQLFGAGDVIDLPAWANVKGIDIPLIGDTDAIDCRLEQIDDTPMVEITIVDGDETTYPDYVHVWNNGQLVDADVVERRADDLLIVPSTPGATEQFYSVSIVPVREGRVFCESITLK